MIPRNRRFATPKSSSRLSPARRFWGQLAILTLALAFPLLATVAVAGPSGYTVTVTVVPSSDAGTVVKSPDYAKYKLNNIVTLTATPASGYVFDGWSGVVSGVTNPVTLRVGGNVQVTATFAKTGAATPHCPLSRTFRPSG